MTVLDRADFTTHQARAALRRLGFGVHRRGQEVPRPRDPAMADWPHGGAEAAARQPYKGRYVAQDGLEILYDSDSPYDVVRWLRKNGLRAAVWKVPATAEDAGSYNTWCEPRPTLDVDIGTGDGVRVRCPVDSGAMNTLLPAWAADLAGIDTADATTTNLGVGGWSAVARLVPTPLTVGDVGWEAEVGFCDPWPRSWGLLGQRSFFRYFTVTFRTADFELEIAPVRR